MATGGFDWNGLTHNAIAVSLFVCVCDESFHSKNVFLTIHSNKQLDISNFGMDIWCV